MLDENSRVLYFHTNLYTPGAEGGIRYSDPRLEISWPLAVRDISERDRFHPLIDSNFEGITL